MVMLQMKSSKYPEKIMNFEQKLQKKFFDPKFSKFQKIIAPKVFAQMPSNFYLMLCGPKSNFTRKFRTIA